MFGSGISERSSALGLDIGSRVVKFVLAYQVADRVDIQAAGAFTLSPGVVEGGIVRSPKKFGKSLAAELAMQGIETAEIIVSVPSSLAALRWINLPLLVGEELREAARFKVRRHLPFPVDAAYVDASTPEVLEGEENTAQYLVITVRKEVIDSRAEAIECAGFTPIGAELEAQAILRIVERRLQEKSPLWRDASLTIIDVGGTNTHMYVVQNQKLQFLRGVRFGADLFSGAVAKELDISNEQAGKAIGLQNANLSANGMLHLEWDGRPATINVQAELDRLIKEFLRLLRYFRSLHPERSYAGILDHVVLCGGMASLLGFDEYLEKQLELRVERAQPFLGMTGNFNKRSFDIVATRQEAYTVVTGLALSALSGRMRQRGERNVTDEYAWERSA